MPANRLGNGVFLYLERYSHNRKVEYTSTTIQHLNMSDQLCVIITH